jgi:hypothetical protein
MNAHSLASKYFSESGKLVQKMFGAIEALLQEDKDRFVIVLVDEIETLTCKRENSLVGREPVDGLRVSLHPHLMAHTDSCEGRQCIIDRIGSDQDVQECDHSLYH